MSEIVYEVTIENGNTYWRIGGKLHRLDGPAYEGTNGYKWWHIDGEEYTEEDFRKKIAKMKSPVAQSCAGKVVEIEGKRYKLLEVS